MPVYYSGCWYPSQAHYAQMTSLLWSAKWIIRARRTTWKQLIRYKIQQVLVKSKWRWAKPTFEDAILYLLHVQIKGSDASRANIFWRVIQQGLAVKDRVHSSGLTHDLCPFCGHIVTGKHILRTAGKLGRLPWQTTPLWHILGVVTMNCQAQGSSTQNEHRQALPPACNDQFGMKGDNTTDPDDTVALEREVPHAKQPDNRQSREVDGFGYQE
eukprot:Gb_03052 [translate_table: standard]